MPVPTYTIVCTQNEVIAPRVHELRFAKPAGLTFKPGQFILFDVPLIETPEDIQTRALSIATTPREGDLLFVMKKKEGGRVSRWIEEKLEEGSTMTIKGPFGFFLVDQRTTKDLLFIATGAGIAPFRSQIMTMLDAKDTRRMDLVFGARTEEDLFWTEELVSLTKRHDNFFLHLCLSAPSDSWKGHRGRVQSLAPLIAKDLSKKSVYVCGNPDMTTELKKLCLGEWRIPKEDVHVEGYI